MGHSKSLRLCFLHPRSKTAQLCTVTSRKEPGRTSTGPSPLSKRFFKTGSRALYEPPHTLRKEFMDTYVPLLDSLQIDNTFEAVMFLQKLLRQKVTYLENMPLHYPTVEEIGKTGKAKCDGVVLFGVNMMRAAGIPAVPEHTVWTRRNGEHYWCSFLNSDGKYYPFVPEYEGPDSLKYNLTHPFLTPAKVYRFEFAPFHPVCLESTDDYKTFLKNPLLDDVTRQYLAPATDIRTFCDFSVSSSQGIIYLCTYNKNHWRPFAISEREGKECVFTDVVGDDIFIIAKTTNKGVILYVISLILFTWIKKEISQRSNLIR